MINKMRATVTTAPRAVSIQSAASLFLAASKKPTAVKMAPMNATGGRLVKMTSTSSPKISSGSRFDDRTTVRTKPSINSHLRVEL
jgi:hypothetical protein